MAPKISILLAAYNSESLLKDVFLPSFKKNCSAEVELVVYDNGGNGLGTGCPECDGDTFGYDWLDYNIVLIGTGENIGLNKALNECARFATGEYFYLPHCDMYLMPGWDTALLNAAKKVPAGQALLCSRSIEPTKGHTEHHIIKDYGKEPNEFKESQLLEDFQSHVDGTVNTGYRMPFFMHRSLWERMAGVDPHYFSYCTDDDLVQTAFHKGVRRFWMVNGSLVYHLQGKSNSQQTVDKDKNEPYEYFVKKWREKGYRDVEHPGQWHPKLIPWYVKV